jgi:hypothetical protein
MERPSCKRFRLAIGISLIYTAAIPLIADESTTSSGASIAEQLQQLRQQNSALQEQLQRQQRVIEDLGKRVEQLQATAATDHTQTAKRDPADAESSAAALTQATVGRIHLSGAGSVAFFSSQSHGPYAASDFRVDEARLLLEAPVWNDLYLFSELLLYQREEADLSLRAGEFYLDAENLSRFWGQDRQLNLRAGRVNIPFGEEYQHRHALDNPLISHSLIDLWGVNEGIEAYGSQGKFSYVLAVQNGPDDLANDFTGDKMVTGRLSYDPATWLHLSGSASRTGAIDFKREKFSAYWIGPGFIRSIGSPATTRFQAELLQGDVQIRLPGTTLTTAGGVLAYSDNDPAANNDRQIAYYSVELVQSLYEGFHAAARWSQMFSPKGYAVAGIGNPGEFAFGPKLTSELHLLSLGVGYRWSPQLVFKVEYSLESGTTVDHRKRDHENLFSATAAFGF